MKPHSKCGWIGSLACSSAPSCGAINGDVCGRIKAVSGGASRGRHLHPVKYDNLQDASYMFVFALN